MTQLEDKTEPLSPESRIAELESTCAAYRSALERIVMLTHEPNPKEPGKLAIAKGCGIKFSDSITGAIQALQSPAGALLLEELRALREVEKEARGLIHHCGADLCSYPRCDCFAEINPLLAKLDELRK